MTNWRIGLLALALAAPSCFGQFSSGSNGSDGALSFTTPGVVDFDPVALGKDADGDNVYHFTTINIATGVTLRLRATKVRNRSVVWLATGAVTIAGTIDLSGADGYPQVEGQPRIFAEPGPGGYPGGAGGRGGSPNPTSGFGPGGGPVANPGAACGAAHANQSGCGVSAYGNSLLVPLRGGSGASGVASRNNSSGAGGGAGGGAVRIASTASITLSGSIFANGGNGPIEGSGGGSGGAIHLQSATLAGAGSLRATGGGGYNVLGGSVGRIRIDAITNSFTGTSQPPANLGTPIQLPLPTTAPTIRVVSVNGVAAPPVPVGSYTAPDVTINVATAVNIAIAATNVPLGTIARVSLASETGTDQTITCAALAGTIASSTATCSAVFPLGITATMVRVTW